MQKIFVWGSGILGIVFIIIAAIYFTHSSGMLPSMMPGFIPGGTNVHYKHGIGTLILGLALFAFAWFQSAPGKSGEIESVQQ